MKRPQPQFWYFAALMSAVLLLGLGGQLISCAKAHAPAEPRAEPALKHHQASAPWNQHPAHGPSVASQQPVSMTARLDRSAILLRGDGIVRVEVAIDTEDTRDVGTVAPSDMVVVVDTSGSMAQEKLLFAQQALHELIDRLQPEDRLALVSYASQSQLLATLQNCTSTHKERLHHITDRLVAHGSTNMSAGLDQATRVLVSGGQPHDLRRAPHDFRASGAVQRTRRVLLLSDGLANAGDSSSSGLRARASSLTAQQAVLTTMGIGADFDEAMMTALATAGTGAFYYLAKLSFLPEFFDAELNSSRSTYATAAYLNFVPAPGVRLETAMGLVVSHDAGARRVTLGNLYAGRTRTIWLTLRAPAHHVGTQPLGSLSLSYARGGHPGAVSVGELPAVACLSDYDRFRQHIDEPVWQRGLMQDVFTRTEERFGDAIRSGDRSELRRALTQAEQEKKLARSLGNRPVLDQLDDLEQQAQRAEQAQRAPAPVRNLRAKEQKARGYQKRNQALYDDVDKAMEAY